MKHFSNRRQRIQQKLTGQSALLIQQPREIVRNNDVHYPFHPNRYFYYLSGFEEPNAWLLITHDKTILWSKGNTPRQTLWEGSVLAEQSVTALDINQWQDVETISTTLLPHLSSLTQLYTIGDLPNSIHTKIKISNGTNIIDAMRVIKDDDEIKQIKKACKISATAHNYLMSHARKATHEGELGGLFYQKVTEMLATTLAYPSIVASGKNACTLHYTKNNATLTKESLVLVDAGCEYNQYCSDITRTFPISGQFSVAQKKVYKAVLAAQESTINMVRPGVTLEMLHQHATEILTKHLIQLGLIEETLEDAISKKLYLDFFPHRIGHTMGLDVHDITIHDEPLAAGMVITIEPGLYIHAPGTYQNIGVRIEDNILVTENGYENLTADAIKSIDDIEALVAS